MQAVRWLYISSVDHSNVGACYAVNASESLALCRHVTVRLAVDAVQVYRKADTDVQVEGQQKSLCRAQLCCREDAGAQVAVLSVVRLLVD